MAALQQRTNSQFLTDKIGAEGWDAVLGEVDAPGFFCHQTILLLDTHLDTPVFNVGIHHEVDGKGMIYANQDKVPNVIFVPNIISEDKLSDLVQLCSQYSPRLRTDEMMTLVIQVQNAEQPNTSAPFLVRLIKNHLGNMTPQIVQLGNSGIANLRQCSRVKTLLEGVEVTVSDIRGVVGNNITMNAAAAALLLQQREADYTTVERPVGRRLELLKEPAAARLLKPGVEPMMPCVEHCLVQALSTRVSDDFQDGLDGVKGNLSPWLKLEVVVDEKKAAVAVDEKALLEARQEASAATVQALEDAKMARALQAGIPISSVPDTGMWADLYYSESLKHLSSEDRANIIASLSDDQFEALTDPENTGWTARMDQNPGGSGGRSGTKSGSGRGGGGGGG